MAVSRGRLTLLAALLALLVAVPAAEARIVVQKGIMGARLGMPFPAVIEKVGDPDGNRVVPNEILGAQRVLRYGKTHVFFDGPGTDTKVVTVTTTSRRQRTKSGVGVGSHENAVKDGVAGVRCGTSLSVRRCIVGRERPGRRVTVFFIKKRTKRVIRVTVGRVID